MTVNYFCVLHKIRREQNQHTILLFFKTNLHFGTTDLISTYENLFFFLFFSHKQHLVGLRFSRNAKKTPKDKGILETFLLCLKSNVSKILKNSRFKKSSLPSVYNIDTTLFDDFFCSIRKMQDIIYYTNFALPKGGALFEARVLEEVRILYPLSPQ